jgi:serine/threonine-protein kinase HipA
MNNAQITLWGSVIGAVSWLDDRNVGIFQYDPLFAESAIELSPLKMPLKKAPYQFNALAWNTFRGLPGLLADSLPDKFGNAVIDAWLASQGRALASFNPVERLCYIGTRGMGALEFQPEILNTYSKNQAVEVARLVELSNQVLAQRSALTGTLAGENDKNALEDILRVGTSAGGARAKAILAWHPVTNEFRSGQIDVSQGFEYWIIKFDGITNNRDKEIADPQGFGKIEYAYSLMAHAAGIEMMPCRLHQEGGRSHFMTRRFDRTTHGKKIHMQSLGALTHSDFNQPDSFSYEQTLQTMKTLGVSQNDINQQVLRTMFNLVGRNQDDHVKNIAFLMNQKGGWRLSPAFDLTYAYNPAGDWTNLHQMSVNGKRTNFTSLDLIALAEIGNIKPKTAKEMLEKVIQAVKQWPHFAQQAGMDEKVIHQIQSTHRLSLLP